MLYKDEVVLVDNCCEFSFDTNCNGGFVDIGFVYSRKDPQQTRARDFILKYLRERGVLAQVVETESDVKSTGAPSPICARRLGATSPACTRQSKISLKLSTATSGPSDSGPPNPTAYPLS
jgi:hypothetical protein